MKRRSKTVSEAKFTVERVKVADLEIDRRVQRDNLKTKKVEDMVRNFNPAALGVIHVSRRDPGRGSGLYVIDGWHRYETVRRVTDNAGEMDAHVYEGLSLADEAVMFLELNNAERVTLHDKYRARLVAEEPRAVFIDQEVQKYGWVVSGVPSKGNINAVAALMRLYDLSVKVEAEPNLIQAVLLVITRAWGLDRHGAQASILEGLGRLLSEHGDRINYDALIDRLQNYRGGPQGLLTEARTFAHSRAIRVSMAVADIITEAYNKGRKQGSKTTLPPWRYRS